MGSRASSAAEMQERENVDFSIRNRIICQEENSNESPFSPRGVAIACVRMDRAGLLSDATARSLNNAKH